MQCLLIGYIIASALFFFAGFGEAMIPGLIPTSLPLPWTDLGDFIETPNGDIYFNSRFFARILRVDASGNFIASYRYPSHEDDAKYMLLALDPYGHIYMKGPISIYTCTTDMQVIATFTQTCSYWIFDEDGHVSCGEPTHPSQPRSDGISRPGEPVFFYATPEREAFHSEDGGVLRRTWLGFEKQRDHEIVATFRPHGVLMLFNTPWFGLPLMVGAFLLLGMLTEQKNILRHYLEARLDQWGSFLALAVFQKTILCPHCWRYTSPFRSLYRHRKRFCEHCQHELDLTIRIKGKLLVIFGTCSFPLDGQTYCITNPKFEVLQLPHRIVVLSNPGFNDPKHRLDISAMFLDCNTCDHQKLERGMTYIHEYLPKRDIQKIHVFYAGTLDNLGEYLQNSVQNTFVHIHDLREGQT